MPIKVVPGSLSEPYKIGQADFSPSLVGLQFTQGSSLFTFGNFELTTNDSGQQLSVIYNTGSFSESYTLETLGITEFESAMLSNETIKTILNIDITNLERFVYFGSFFEFISTSIEQIILKWKGSLFIQSFIPLSPTPKNTVLEYSYDSINDKSYFKVPYVVIKNTFGLIYSQDSGGPQNSNVQLFNQTTDNLKISNLNIHYTKYEIQNLYGNFGILGFTGGTNNNQYIYFEVKGNSWPALDNIGFGSFDFHIRPKEEVINKYFFNHLNEFENNVLNRLTSPKYTAEIRIPKKTNDGTTFFSNKRNTWPTSDGFNIDTGGSSFTSYMNKWLDIAKDIDETKTDLIARRFITSSIIEFDTEGDGTEVYGRKVNKLLRIYGREFDEIKKYIDALSFSKVVTYDKKDNAPDEIIKIMASELGLDVLLSYFDNNLFNNILPENSGTEGYGNEIFVQFDGYSRNLSPQELDTELWRRLVINAWWLFKSKGHRKVLEFFLNLFGIPECIVSLDECVYIAKNRLDVEETVNTIANYLGLAPDEITVSPVPNTEIPMDEYGFPKVFNDSPDYYYQSNGFWYNGGNLSELGNNPHIGPYDYGKNYLGRLECFIENFEGTVSGLTTFTTIENLFVDYENGTIENGVSDYGEEYATIMNDSNIVSQNLIVSSAGATNDITYGGSEKSLGITFTLERSNCELICPDGVIYYENGLIISTDGLGVDVDSSFITDLYSTDVESLLFAATLSEFCCVQNGGYYIPIGIPTNPPIDTDGSTAFSVEELFAADDSGEQQFGCYWCPPVTTICGLDYYLNRTPQTKQLVEEGDGKGGGGTGGGGGGPLTQACTFTYSPGYGNQIPGVHNIDVLPPSYQNQGYSTTNVALIVHPSSTQAQSGDIMCSTYNTATLWSYIPGTDGSGTGPLYSRGCCVARWLPGNGGGNGGGSGDGELADQPLDIGDLVLTPNDNPCSGQITIVDGVYFIDNNPAPIGCCTDGVIGLPASWNNNQCINPTLTTPVGGTCDPNTISIDEFGFVNGITNSVCCTNDFVGFPVFWDGNNCKLVDNNFCVITSIDGQNITNAECCSNSGGYLGVDGIGQVICIEYTDDPTVGTPSNCTDIINNLTFTQAQQNDLTVTTALDYLGNDLSSECCHQFSTTEAGNGYSYNTTIKKCTKEEKVILKACRYYLIESIMSTLQPYSQYHFGGDFGIYGIEEKVNLRITTLKVNGVDYLSQFNTIPQTVLTPNAIPVDNWNSVLFLQKTFDDFGLINYKAQLPGNPANVSATPNSQGNITDVFIDGYGFYIIRPEDDIFEITLQYFTQSKPDTINRITYKNNNTQTSEPQYQLEKIPFECIYDVDITTQPSGGGSESCYVITYQNDNNEPKQCYPFTLGGNTFG